MVVMGEGDNNDCWSLLAIVNECSRMTKTRAQLVINDNVLKTTTVPTTTTVTLTPTPQLDYIEMDHSYGGYKSFFDDQFMLMNNSSGFWLPSTSAGVVTATPAAAEVTSSNEESGGFWLSSAEGAVTTSPAADVTSSEEELRGPFLVPYKPPVVFNNAKAEPVVVTGRMASKPLVEQTTRQHPRPRDSQMIPNQSLPAAVTRGCKKKKLENRRIVRLTEEELSTSDKWSWRKYGQKPIKGSQYPRNYYRCSTIKGCRARKQVERCPMNSKIYIVTYSHYHHHPYPPIRNTPGPRVRYTTKSNPPPKVESPTNTVFGPVGGTNGMITVDDDDEYVAGENSSFSSGETNEGYIYNNADFQVPVMNSMTYSELLTGTEQQNGEGNSTCITINTSNNNDKYDSSYYNENNNNNNVGYNLGCDPNVKRGVQVEENGSGYSVGNGEMYAPGPAPATTNGSGYGVGNREMYAPAPATNGPGYGVGNREMYAPAAPATNASGYGVGNGEMYAPAPATDGSGYGFGNREIYAPAPATANGSGYGVSNRDMYAPAPATNVSGYGVANREMYAPAPATTNGSGYGVGNREMYAPAPSTNGWGYGVNNREMYAPAPATLAGVNQPPPNYVGQNSKHIWNIEMIKNSPGFFA